MLKNGWMLALLTAVLLAAFVVRQTGDGAWADRSARPAEAAAQTAMLMSPQDAHHHEATLTDATQLYRVCSSRPQRLLPTHGAKTERTANPCGAVRRNIVKPLYFLHDSRRRLETAPHALPASCDYYVIALRHIIR